jgi:hypothetical protein
MRLKICFLHIICSARITRDLAVYRDTKKIHKDDLSAGDIVYFPALDPRSSDNLTSVLYSAHLNRTRPMSDHPVVILDMMSSHALKVKICFVREYVSSQLARANISQVRTVGRTDSLENRKIPVLRKKNILPVGDQVQHREIHSTFLHHLEPYARLPKQSYVDTRETMDISLFLQRKFAGDRRLNYFHLNQW